MNLDNLINTKKAKVAVIGLGYVGLPTAVELAKSGYRVFGLDVSFKKINKINKGESYIADVSSKELKKIISSKKLTVSSRPELLKECDIILICVPTPLTKNKVPNVSYIQEATKIILKNFRKGKLIILESSTYPGTTREIILPELEKQGLKAGKDFFLAFSPERIDPGNKNYKFSEVSRVVGGITSKCTKIAAKFYKSFIRAGVFPLSSTEAAEMTKILENTFRLVNISMINELALLCGRLEIDIWEVIEAAKTKPYGFMPFYPSPKIGGHCIPLDPFYLSYKAKEYNFWPRFIDLAGEINDQMPHYTVTRISYALNKKNKSISGAKILIFGASYKKDIEDARESAILDIIPDLIRKGAKIDYLDPHYAEIEIKERYTRNPIILKSIKQNSANDYSVFKKYDLVLILTDHSGFDYDKIAKSSNLVVDTRNAIKSRKYKNVFRL